MEFGGSLKHKCLSNQISNLTRNYFGHLYVYTFLWLFGGEILISDSHDFLITIYVDFI